MSLLMLPAMANAETLVLKSGKTITGKILQEDSEFVQIEYNGAPVYFERKTIRQIDQDSPAACADAESCLQQGLGVFASSDKTGDEDCNQAKRYFEQGLTYESGDRDLRSVMIVLDDMDKGIVPREYAALLFRGSYYLMNNEYEKGAASLEKALELNPSDTNIYYNLGLAYHALGRDQQALSYLKKLIELRPADAQAYSLAGVVCLAVEDRQQAKEYLLIARKLFEKSNDREKLRDIDSMISASF
jgi:tetratricopeptide (TPR) repeat protein